jgi:hypothetical protein
MRTPLSTGVAAMAVAALIALPLIAAGPALAMGEAPSAETSSAGETTSLVVAEPSTGTDPVDPEAPSAPAPEPEPAPVPEPAPETEPAVPSEPSSAAPTDVAAESPEQSSAPASAAEQEAVTDTTPPEFFAWTPAANQVFFGDGRVTIDFECRDSESGISDCALYDHNDHPQTNGEPLWLPSGHYFWTAVAVNSIGLRFERVYQFWVANPGDTTAPSFTPVTPVMNGAYSGQGDEFVDYSCADAESPIFLCVVRDHEGHDVAPGSPLKLPEGDYTWTGIASNANGLVTKQEIKFSVKKPDTTRPEVTSDWDVADGDWSNRKTLRVSATDGGSGIRDIQVQYDGRRIWNSDTAEVELLHGSRTIEFWATDDAGNESEHKTLQLNIDLGLPTITVDSEIAPDGLSPVEVIQGSDVPFSYTCTDDYSGVANCTSAYPSGRALPTGELGEHGFTIDAFDNAGNRTTRMFRYVVAAPTDPTDSTAPSFSSVTPAMNGVYTGTGDEYVDFSCADVESGIEKCGMWDQDGDPVAVGAPLELADGDYTWTGIAVNSIGLRTTQVIQFTVQAPDTTRPEVSSDWDVPAGEWSNRDTITITATDTGSGINGIWADYDGETYVDNEETLEFEPADGSQTIEFWAADNAGNQSEHGFIDVNLDRALPEIQADSEIAPAGLAADGIAPIEVKKGAVVPFAYTCTDALSGVEKCTSAHASGDALPTNELGEHTFTVDAIDKAGNRTTRAFTYVVVADSDPVDPVDPTDPVDPVDPTDPTDGSGAGTASSPTSGGLASTGLDLGWLPAISIALLALGAGVIVMCRRLARV